MGKEGQHRFRIVQDFHPVMTEMGADPQILLDRHLGQDAPAFRHMRDAALDDRRGVQPLDRTPLRSGIPAAPAALEPGDGCATGLSCRHQLAPRMATTLPAGTLRETPCSAWIRP